MAMLSVSTRWWVNPSSILVVATLALFSVLLLVRRFRFLAKFRGIPGPPALPLFGNALGLLGSQAEVFKLQLKYFQEYGDVYRMWIGFRPFVFIGSAEAVQPLLTSTVCIDKSLEYDLLHEWIGTGLVTSTGEKWHHRRKLLTPSFHFKLLETFIKPACYYTDILIEQLRKEVGKDSFDIFSYAKLVAVDVIGETAMGCRLNAQKNGNLEFVKAINTLTAIEQRRFLTPWLKINCIFKLTAYSKQLNEAVKTVHDLRKKMVQERRSVWRSQRKDAEENGKTRLTLLDFMLEMNMSDKDVGEEVDTFMFAGHDTVATTFSWCLYVLAQQKDAQERILREFDFLAANTESPYSVTSLNRLDYLDRCIKEIMRLYAPVPLIARQTYAPIKIKDYIIPSGTAILTNIHAIHRDSRHFSEPNKFDPDRFLPENNVKRHTFSFIPFSAGSRNCIGQKYAMLVIKVLLIRTLQAYEISTNLKPEDLRMVSELVLQNEGGLPLHIEERRRIKK